MKLNSGQNPDEARLWPFCIHNYSQNYDFRNSYNFSQPSLPNAFFMSPIIIISIIIEKPTDDSVGFSAL